MPPWCWSSSWPPTPSGAPWPGPWGPPPNGAGADERGLAGLRQYQELGLANPSLRTVRLPKTPYHRFLLEDVPYGFLAVSRLGRLYGVPTPLIDQMVALYQTLLGDRADMTGPEFPSRCRRSSDRLRRGNEAELQSGGGGRGQRGGPP